MRNIFGWSSFLRVAATSRILVRATALLPVSAALVSGVFVLPPAAQAQGLTRLERVVVSTTGFEAFGAVFHSWSDDNGASWSPWSDLGRAGWGQTFGTPAVVSDGATRLNIIAQSTSSGLAQNTYANGVWSGWTSIPGTNGRNICVKSQCYSWSSSPTVTSWGPGRMDLFLVAFSQLDGSATLLHTWADKSTWSGTWESLGATGQTSAQGAAGTPGAVSWGPGRIDVFVTGGSNELKHKSFDKHKWSSDWESLGGILTSPPVVASMGPGLLTVFTRGTDMNLYYNNFSAGGWAGWAAPPTPCCLAGDVTNSVAVTSRAPGTLDVLVIGTQHDLYHRAYSAGGWAAWQFVDNSLNYDNIAVAAWAPLL